MATSKKASEAVNAVPHSSSASLSVLLERGVGTLNAALEGKGRAAKPLSQALFPWNGG